MVSGTVVEDEQMDLSQVNSSDSNHLSVNEVPSSDKMEGNGTVDGVVESQVLILDAGAQYGKLIDRRVRELSVHSEVLPLNTPASKIQLSGAKWADPQLL